jgi:hypothetical protein
MDNTDALQVYGEGSSFRGQIKEFVRTVIQASNIFMEESVVDGGSPTPFTILTKQRITALLTDGEYLNGIPDSKVIIFIQLHSSLILFDSGIKHTSAVSSFERFASHSTLEGGIR